MGSPRSRATSESSYPWEAEPQDPGSIRPRSMRASFQAKAS